MSNRSRSVLLRTALAAVVSTILSDVAESQVQPAIRWVDVQHASASDNNPGTEALPWETIGHALDTVGEYTIIKVKYGVYAPTTGQGRENVNDFPLTIDKDGVQLVGIRDATNGRPVISAVGMENQWNPPNMPLKSCVFIHRQDDVVTGAKIKDFVFDNASYSRKKSDFLHCVAVIMPDQVAITGCDFIDSYTGMRIETIDDETTTSVTVSDCYFTKFLPRAALAGNDEEEGHAGIRSIGPENLSVNVVNSTFETNHDGIDASGDPIFTDADLPWDEHFLFVQGCHFEDNETGLEAFNNDVTVTSSSFVKNRRKGVAAGGVDTPTSGIGIRGVTASLKVRTSVFTDNNLAIMIKEMDPGPVDLGTGPADRGLNVFSMPLTGSDSAFSFGILRIIEPIHVDAVGNTWLPNEQGANAQGLYPSGWAPPAACTGCAATGNPGDCTFGHVGVANLPAVGPPASGRNFYLRYDASGPSCATIELN